MYIEVQEMLLSLFRDGCISYDNLVLNLDRVDKQYNHA